MMHSKGNLVWIGILVPLLFVGAVLYWVMPGNREMIQRLEQDGQFKRALRYVRTLPEPALQEAPVFYRTTDFRLQRRLLDPADTKGIQQYLQQVLRRYEASQYDARYLDELLAGLPLLTNAVPLRQLIDPAGSEFPASARKRVYPVLVKTALAASAPHVAAAWQQEYLDLEPDGGSIEEIEKLARVWRMAGEPEKGLRVLDQRLELPIASWFEQYPKLAVLNIELLRELNRNGEAFDFLQQGRSHWEPASQEVRDWLAEQMVAAARASGRTAELLSYHRRQVERHPNEPGPWRNLAESATAAKEFNVAVSAYRKLVQWEPDNAAFRRQFARVLEWNDQPDQAFEQYAVLAGQLDFEALDRMRQLNEGLYRTADLVAALQEVVPVPDQPRYTLDLAEARVRLGEYAEAKANYRRYLQSNPDSPDVVARLAELHFVLYEFADALKYYSQAVSLAEEPLAYQKRVADCLSHLGRYEEAFVLFQKLSRTSKDLEVIENYIQSAYSLGRYEAMTEGLVRKIEVSEEVKPVDYLALNESYRFQGRASGQEDALKAALERFPENDPLLQAYARQLADSNRYRRAYRVLGRHSRLRTDPAIADFYLDLVIANSDFETGRTYVESDVSRDVEISKAFQKRKGYILIQTRQFEAAVKVYRELYDRNPADPETAFYYATALTQLNKKGAARRVVKPFLQGSRPESTELAAKMAALTGDYEEAEQMQVSYLNNSTQATPKEWGFLGDIRKDRGDTEGAEQAYRRALRLMMEQYVLPRRPRP